MMSSLLDSTGFPPPDWNVLQIFMELYFVEDHLLFFIFISAHAKNK